MDSDRNKGNMKLEKALNLWERRGCFYHAELDLWVEGKVMGTMIKKLDFVSYHLIKLIHGESKLRDMALTCASSKIKKLTKTEER